MLNLRSVDLNLLTVFEAVYEERNQARAALRLAMTQPAVSNAIARLRHVVRDPLFVPASRGVVPTPAAERLYPRVREALSSLREGLAGERGFDPRTTTAAFDILIGYGGGAILGPPLLHWIDREAPRARLRIRSLDDPATLPRRLRDGQLDAAVDYVAPVDPDLVHEQVADAKPVVIVRRDHPRVRGRVTRAVLARERLATHLERHPGAACAKSRRCWRGWRRTSRSRSDRAGAAGDRRRDRPDRGHRRHHRRGLRAAAGARDPSVPGARGAGAGVPDLARVARRRPGAALAARRHPEGRRAGGVAARGRARRRRRGARCGAASGRRPEAVMNIRRMNHRYIKHLIGLNCSRSL